MNLEYYILNKHMLRSMGIKKKNWHGGGNALTKICPNLTQAQDYLVLVFPKLTNTPSKFTKNISKDTKTMETQETLFGNECRTSTFSLGDSLVNLFQSPEREADLTILEELYSLKSQGLWPLKDLSYAYWKTSEDCYHTIKGKPLEPSLQPFLDWGIFANGRYLTARISESRRTGNECSLSDILEEEVDDKYFLSEKETKRLEKIINATATPQSISTIVSQKLQQDGVE